MPCNYPPKPWLSTEQQIELMQSRGLIISDIQAAETSLKKFGYYRLSGYSYVLRESYFISKEENKLNSFKKGASFDYVIQLYEFDKRLRLLLLDAIERIEISLRSSISYHLGQRDPKFYDKPGNFKKECRCKGYLFWLEKLNKKIKESKEDCILHYLRFYGEDNIPVWVICQTWDFGQASWLLQLLNSEWVEIVSQQYGFKGAPAFLSWLKCFNELRNICAHHSRLWNRRFSLVPKTPSGKDLFSPIRWSSNFTQTEKRKLFFYLCGLVHFIRFIEPESEWADKMKAFMTKFPTSYPLGITLETLGFIPDWENFIDNIKK